MKKLLLIASLLMASVSFAQRGSASELNANLGFTAGAINLGATYEQNRSDVMGLGGYFFLQTEKDDAAVYQVMALGALMKIHLVQKGEFDAYIAPGFGITMISDYPTGPAAEDDKTVFGPSLKLGAQLKFSPAFNLGVERMIVTNWFEEKAPSALEGTTLSMTFNF